jgi:Abortive infection alpha
VSAQPGATYEHSEEVSLTAALPGLARIAAIASIRAVEWTAGAYVRAGSRLIRAAASGASPGEALQQTGDELVSYIREMLGVTSNDGQGSYAPARPPEEPVVDAEVVEPEERPTQAWLRERGEELLRRSAEIELEEDAHPAYARILGDLAPDEARILRLLVQKGPQPAVDVRTGGPIGIIKDELVAPGLNMIGMEAGTRFPSRVDRYLNNLYRLGLIWFSREELEDQARYQVLEAQPEVSGAMEQAGRARTIRRSINLTPFGKDFCAMCLPVDTGEIEALGRDE